MSTFCLGLAESLECPCVWIGLKQEDGAIKCCAKAGEASIYLDTTEMRWDNSRLGQNSAGMAIRTRAIQFLDLRGLNNNLPWLATIKALKINSALALPILCGDDEVLGVLVIYSNDIQCYEPEKVELLESFALQLSLLLEMEKGSERVLRYSFLSEHSRDIFLFVRPDGRIVDANAAAEAAYGYTRSELQAMRIFDLRLDKSTLVTNQMNKAAAEGILFETFHRRKDGSVFPVEVSSRGGDFKDGPILLSVIRDMSDRRRIESKLKESEERYREIVNHMSDGVAVYTVGEHGDFMIAEYNSAAERIGQITRAEIVGRPLKEVFPGLKENGQLVKTLNRVWKTGQAEHCSASLYHDDRITKWTENYIFKLSSCEIVNIFRDVTEQKQAEEALWAAKEHAQVTLNSIGDAVITTDAHGNIDFMNPVAEGVTGWHTEDARGLPLLNVFNIISEVTGLPAENPVAKCLKTGRIVGLANHTILINRFDKQIYIEDSASPIRDRQGRLIGAVLVFYDVTEKRKLLNELHYLARYDGLTGLPNRSMFHSALDDTLNSKHKLFALFFIDIDRFKFINDNFGHAVGDLLLIEISKRIQNHLGGNDLICRYGGDEFAVIVRDSEDQGSIFARAEQIIKSCAEKLVTQGHELYITISMGLALYPNHGVHADSLIKHADLAMYSAKKSGGNKFNLYIADVDTEMSKRFAMIGMLNRALENREFALYYQPQIDLTSRKIIGVEALLRWFSPDGLIMPDQYISFAEETGLIIPIGEWVLREACRQCRSWIDKGYPPLQMSVNISSKQFYQLDFVDKVIEILKDNDIHPHMLTLEITESVAMQKFSFAAMIIERLNSFGIKIAIDDFGTGYSSLSYLANMHVNFLKIDKSLIQNLNVKEKRANITTAIINLAKNLNMEVIAEGIENAEDMAFLEAMCCDQAQGYLISKPLPGEEMEQLIIKEVKGSQQLNGVHMKKNGTIEISGGK